MTQQSALAVVWCSAVALASWWQASHQGRLVASGWRPLLISQKAV
jgi:hypothetical protein